MAENHPLIHLEGLKKVFYTEEVETHALSDIHHRLLSDILLGFRFALLPGLPL